MKKIVATIFISVAFLVTISGVNAQMMGGNVAADDHTAREEAEGKVIWQKLQNKEVGCTNLSDDDFDALGEYFMGTMMGNSHPAMNQMMVTMMGEEGEKQMHIVMGKRLSGCDTTAAFPSGGVGLMSMMQMMMGGNNPMMGNLGQNQVWWGSIGSLLISLLWFVWLIAGIFAAVWLWKQIIKK